MKKLIYTFCYDRKLAIDTINSIVKKYAINDNKCFINLRYVKALKCIKASFDDKLHDRKILENIILQEMSKNIIKNI